MKRTFFFICVNCCVLLLLGVFIGPGQLPAQDAPPLHDDLQVVRAYFSEREMVSQLAQEREPWEVDYTHNFIVIDADRAQRDELEAAGFRVELQSALTEQIQRPRMSAPNQQSGIPGFACYRTVEESFASAEDLVSDYPNLASWDDIGDSWRKSNLGDGYDIMALTLTNQAVAGDKPKMLIITGIHAREYAPPELSLRFAEGLLADYGSDADATWLLDEHEIHFILSANPDARKQAETGLLWRKNTNQDYCGATSNARGADLNRNFEFQWGCCNGSSSSQCSDTFRGSSAGSEPEVDAIQNYVRAIFPDQRGPNLTDAAPANSSGIFLDLHSYGDLVIWPWGFTSTLSPNATALQTLGRKLAYFNNYEPFQAAGLYPTDGTTDDFAYGELGVASYTYEVGTSFFQDCSTFENRILPDNLASLRYAAKVARAPYLTPAGPEVINLSLSEFAIFPGQSVSVTAIIDDTRFGTRRGIEPSQSIVAAEYFIDVPPWSVADTPQPLLLNAQDGTFDSSVEAVIGIMNTDTLSEGRHTVFVRGQDEDGNWGPVTAQFLYVLDSSTAATVSGTVTAADSGDPIVADIAIGQFSTVSGNDGIYQTAVFSGTYDVSIVPRLDEFAPLNVVDFIASGGESTMQNFVIQPYCRLLEDDAESFSTIWSADGGWVLSNVAAHSGEWSWTDSPNGSYSNNLDASLSSQQPINLAGYDHLELSFWHRCRTEPDYDYCRVELSTDGVQWEEVAVFDGYDDEWENVILSLDPYGGEAALEIRFRLTTDGFVQDDGWFLDDIVLRGTGPACLASKLAQSSYLPLISK